jgi:hypothetical protein
MQIDLTDEEAVALLALLDRAIEKRSLPIVASGSDAVRHPPETSGCAARAAVSRTAAYGMAAPLAASAGPKAGCAHAPTRLRLGEESKIPDLGQRGGFGVAGTPSCFWVSRSAFWRFA